jgi:hypothetical protein
MEGNLLQWQILVGGMWRSPVSILMVVILAVEGMRGCIFSMGRERKNKITKRTGVFSVK